MAVTGVLVLTRPRNPYFDVPDQILSRLKLPLVRVQSAGWFNAKIRSAQKELRRAGCTRIVAYCWTPNFHRQLAFCKSTCDKFVYHIDDEYSYSPSEVPNSRQEQKILDGADTVIVTSEQLRKKKGGVHIPNGVDYQLFAGKRDEPQDLAGIAHPRIGYTGWLKNQLDWNLLTYLAGARPDWNFVFVGPVKPHAAHQATRDAVAVLQPLPNCHFLGAKSVTELAAYPQHFDVALMPYAMTDYTKYINPLKMYEYLASGTPIVSSSVPAVLPFEKLISICSEPASWVESIQGSLGLGGAEKRQEAARANDWSIIVNRVTEILEGKNVQS